MIIEAQNLVKRYGRVYGLKKASFRVEQGKITGLLGPNGAGKTTTMRILTTFLKPTSGEAWVNGHSIFFEGYKIRKEIGYLPEHSPIYPEMTVQEYLHFRAALKRVDRKKRKKEVEELMANFGLSTYAHRLISELSKGYRQRVGFCEALLGYPPLMILDEPTSGMDPLQKNELLQWIQSLVPDHSILFSSHILRDVERICSHVIILNQGEVMAQGSIDELKKKVEDPSKVVLETTYESNKFYPLLEKSPFSIQCKKQRENSFWQYTLRFQNIENQSPSLDLPSEIARFCYEHKIPFRQLYIPQPSLEDIFEYYTKTVTSKESS